MYTSIPFMLSLQDGVAHGLFLDHPGRVELDLAKADPERMSGTVAGALVYYVFAGPTPRARARALHGADRADRAAADVGARQPAVALGLHGPPTRSAAIARGYRERGIPCDVLYLDIDYMDGYRVFTWDPERFPDPEGLIAELRRATASAWSRSSTRA